MKANYVFNIDEEPLLWGNTVLVKLRDQESGLIIMPDDFELNEDEGTIVAFGEEAKVPRHAKIGTRVTFRKFGGEIYKRRIGENKYESLMIVNCPDVHLSIGKRNEKVNLDPEELEKISNEINKLEVQK